MSCDLLHLATKGVAGLQPYHPGKPIEELQRELGLTDIVKLASNENPLGPAQAVLDAIRETTELSRYPDGNGYRLKRALAQKHDVEPEQITLGNGSNDILEMVAHAFANESHQVIYSAHAFAVYRIVAQSVGAEHVVIPTEDWCHDLPAMLAAVTDNTRLMFIANPNNPTGTWVDTENLHELLEQIPTHVIVVVDEAYFEYAEHEPDYPDASQWLAHFPNLVVTRTFSKAYGIAGLRMGYGLSHVGIASLLNRVRQPFNNNMLALTAAEIALQDNDYIEQSVRLNDEGMKTLICACDDMGLEFIPSKGNFICIDFEQQTDAIYQALLHQGVIVRPLANYGMPNHLRVSIGLEHENKRFITALSSKFSV